jgi:ribosomal protein S18 acetylase RimI-like enzyme
MHVDVTIRKAELRDAFRLAELMCELGYQTTGAEMQTRLQSILKNPAYKTFVAEMNGALFGMIGLHCYPSYNHNDSSGHIIALVVSTRARQRGVGRALIRAGEEYFAKRNITRVALTTRFEREVAHRFYEKLGYARTGFRFGKNLTRASD